MIAASSTRHPDLTAKRPPTTKIKRFKDLDEATLASLLGLSAKARKSLKIVWDEGPVASQSTAGYLAQAKQLAGTQASQTPLGGGPRSAKEGDAEATFKTAAKFWSEGPAPPFKFSKFRRRTDSCCHSEGVAVEAK